jgi:glutamate dehydrogenase/leucine dehydrogenase
LWHPQEGIINGHYKAKENERIHQIGQLRYGVSKVLEDTNFSPDVKRKYVVADMITGYGVSESIRHFYSLYGGDISQKRAIIQGWGNVGAAAAFYLAQQGVKIVGIIDRVGGLVNTEGYTLEEIRTLFLNREGNTLVANNLIPFEQINEQIWATQAEIFVPAAASRLVTKNQVEQLIGSGLEVIACGANVPFADSEIFFGPIMEYADEHVAVIPDFISNCGMARVFAYLMSEGAEVTDQAIFADVSDTILTALQRSHTQNQGKTKLSQTSYEIALAQLM